MRNRQIALLAAVADLRTRHRPTPPPPHDSTTRKDECHDGSHTADASGRRRSEVVQLRIGRIAVPEWHSDLPGGSIGGAAFSTWNTGRGVGRAATAAPPLVECACIMVASFLCCGGCWASRVELRLPPIC